MGAVREVTMKRWAAVSGVMLAQREPVSYQPWVLPRALRRSEVYRDSSEVLFY